jgi:serine protease inhibitor
MRRYASICVIAALLGVGWVYTNRVSSARPDPRLVKADNDFAFRLYREIAKKDSGKNIFISPVSIALALQMTYNGATDTVAEGMAKALGLEEISLEDLNLANARLFSMLESPSRGVELNIANSAWTNKKLIPEFTRNIGRSYHAEFGPLQVNAINSWVDRQTKGKIKKMVDHIEWNEFLVLLNAIYFKGKWQSRFDAQSTENMPFLLSEGKEKMVPTMHQTSGFAVVRSMGVKGIRLPYSKGRIAMYVFVPDSLDSFLASLDGKKWESWMSEFGKPEEVGVYLPKFELEYEKDLEGQLRALGMTEAFDGLDFENIIEGGQAYISRIKHKAVVEVNEEGTRAAAATSVEMCVAGGGPPSFHVDRPFFFAIRDDKTGLILFMGSVVDPTEG